ncbi:MAG: hypothetical protein E7634_02625 [Ruminococcaceae bacterium]|nr:hypothetical protein [Oscillospiraceae bacterium]
MKLQNRYSPALIRRLPAYFRTLIDFYGKDRSRISSEELASAMGITPSQVRADISAIGCQGQRSYGYGIPTLYKTIGEILQLSDKFSAIMIGESHIARAVAETPVFAKRGVKLLAVFADMGCAPSPDALPFEALDDFFTLSRPNIVMIAGNAENAEKTAEKILSLTEAQDSEAAAEIWNFTDATLQNNKIKVKNFHLSDHIMMLCLEAGK